jgi:hypothetical protein
VVTFLQLLFSQHIAGADFFVFFRCPDTTFLRLFCGNILVLFSIEFASSPDFAGSMFSRRASFLSMPTCLENKKNVFLKKLDGKYLSFKPSKTGDPKHGNDF